MSDKKGEIVFSKHSPYMVVDAKITDNKTVLNTPRVVSICRCGQSSKMPLCDGSHSEAQFLGERQEEDSRGTKEYKGTAITIHDNRYICCHDGSCIKLLPTVFRRKDRPWIDPDGATVEEIINTIKKCPSGALSYSIDNKKNDSYFENQEIIAERGGPLHIRGTIEIIDDNNSDALLISKNHCTLCRCGESTHIPYCDGSHHDIDFEK